MQNAWHKKANWNDKGNRSRRILHLCILLTLHYSFEISVLLMLKLGEQTPHYTIALWQWRFLFRQLKLCIIAYIESMAWHSIAQQTQPYYTFFGGQTGERAHAPYTLLNDRAWMLLFTCVLFCICAHLSSRQYSSSSPQNVLIVAFFVEWGLNIIVTISKGGGGVVASAHCCFVPYHLCLPPFKSLNTQRHKIWHALQPWSFIQQK